MRKEIGRRKEYGTHRTGFRVLRVRDVLQPKKMNENADFCNFERHSDLERINLALQLSREGMSDRQIGRELKMSPKTIRR